MTKTKMLFCVQIAAYFISSLMLCLLPTQSTIGTNGQKTSSIVMATIFWLFLIIGLVMNIFIKKANNDIDVKGKMGLVCFFKTKLAMWFDIAMMVSFIGSLIVVISKSSAYFGAIVLALFVFTFEMHCILNGKHFNI